MPVHLTHWPAAALAVHTETADGQLWDLMVPNQYESTITGYDDSAPKVASVAVSHAGF